MTTVWIVTAEHFSVPGIITRVFATPSGANEEAARIVRTLLRDCSVDQDMDREEILADAMPDNWEEKLSIPQEIYGAAHCYVEVAQHEVKP